MHSIQCRSNTPPSHGEGHGGRGYPSELIAEVEQMDLETTMTFVEIKELDKKDAASMGLTFPVPEVNL
jgi:hypothetical protein